MQSARGVVVLSLCTVLGCGGESPPPAAAPPPPPLAAASAMPSAAQPLPPAEPTPEEKRKAEAARHLQEDRAKWVEENKAELARWTPELHAAVKGLAEKAYPDGRAALQEAIASKHRKPGNAERDKARHPAETLAFFGFKPTLTVVEVSPGEGWYTELLAPALAAKGKLIATTSDPSGPDDQRSTFYGQRFKAFLAKAPEVYGKVQTIVVDDKVPSLGSEATADMVIVMRAVHGMVNSGTLPAWLGAINNTLKPSGVLGIEEHRAPANADPVESAKKGYVPENWLVAQVEAAGFKLAGKSEINANPKDTKDYSEGVWALPPTLRLGDQDRAKYLAIGESDRMTLKFIKAPAVVKPADKPAAGKPVRSKEDASKEDASKKPLVP